ncbi:MAG: hypothetical protein KJ069_16580 [Anaerolineae bacterium]|nr:hypothetical protein [Anaerolineae bacterium]
MNGKFHFLGFVAIFLFAVLMGCADDNARRVLFVGNSYTDYNDLPKMFSQLADAGGHSVRAEKFTQAGWRLADHVAATELLDRIEQGEWDMVILQEQSILPATVQRGADMYPAARALHQHITVSGGQTVFFLTWARQEGTAVQEIGFNAFNDMQTQLTAGYGQIAQELGVPVAPVGAAWQKTLAAWPQAPLYSADGSHPAKHGTYLAAAVFYALLFQETPEGLHYTAGLPQEDAAFLQRMAAETVLTPVP